jgi:hypothetical protein
MRRIMQADLVATAQLLARLPAADRPTHLDRLLSQTQAADCFSRRFDRPHPHWGNGSLLSRALSEATLPLHEDHHYWASLSLVAAAIAARRSTT